MAKYEFRMQRLFVEAALAPDAEIAADKTQANYLLNVLRLAEGDEVLLFNGRDGEWRARLKLPSRKSVLLCPHEQTRPQPSSDGLVYLFAPLKHARLDYMVQKAVEMGAARLVPVITAHTQATRVNTERMTANVIEAAEQCGILGLAAIEEPRSLAAVLADWTAREGERRIIFCDESDEGANPLQLLSALRDEGGATVPPAVLIGPEGGFSAAERAQLKSLPFVSAIPLGPRILRADTAAVAALAIVQSVIGDW
ncbi:16S rRNA (uracil(1498)-N(3))-methyltransferase [Pannonibacter indicus]|uniref:Ribosomal RNA small subunit methyltransferase E n=1 Tax=Pannonibacter indicus TaxID=466044 RepID=A0A0K6HUN2_9HYPH|nr:16S rRNA (uracil(1498)-N(3))-methyltransferase [Pannonibacter indicus]CUA94590.1 RNA methyltransferase, RsmE family [Pannonibacter indicus]